MSQRLAGSDAARVAGWIVGTVAVSPVTLGWLTLGAVTVGSVTLAGASGRPRLAGLVVRGATLVRPSEYLAIVTPVAGSDRSW
jgi:hypothetical protein